MLVDLSFRNDLETLNDTVGLKSLFQKQAGGVIRVPVGSEYIARDMDTWYDYSRLYFDVFAQAPPVGK